MTHNLVTNYGLLDKMDVFVSGIHIRGEEGGEESEVVSTDLYFPCPFSLVSLVSLSLAHIYLFYFLQRPTRATNLQMTRFHSDEYIDFLERVTPETVEELSGNGTRCEFIATIPGRNSEPLLL